VVEGGPTTGKAAARVLAAQGLHEPVAAQIATAEPDDDDVIPGDVEVAAQVVIESPPASPAADSAFEDAQDIRVLKPVTGHLRLTGVVLPDDYLTRR